MANKTKLEHLQEKYADLLSNKELDNLCSWNLRNSGIKLDDDAYVDKAKNTITDFAEKITAAINSISS